MKRLPKTPANADPETLRWVARYMDVHYRNAVGFRKICAEAADTESVARYEGKRNLAGEVRGSMLKRAGQIEGKRRRARR